MYRLPSIGKNLYKNFINKNILFNSKPISLGRWSMDYKNIDRKVDYANEDNCGLCDVYRLQKIKELNKKTSGLCDLYKPQIIIKLNKKTSGLCDLYRLY
tara:strand:+ start:411 stop:707 length:297 start_codon:yes stop_codon:yes gene_type:complete